MNKILTIIIIFCGEVAMIFAEVLGAKYYHFNSQPFIKTFFKLMPVLLLGALMLLAGYMFGLKTLKNIWIVSVISITSILIAEPIINYTITHQLPTKGALIGFIFGVLGFIAALF